MLPVDGDELAPLDAATLAELGTFLPRFAAPGFVGGTWEEAERAPDGSLPLPSVALDDDVRDLEALLYRRGVLVAFDWPAWSTEGQRLLAAGVDGLDQRTLRRLLTMLVRADRFTTGTLLGAFADGTLPELLAALVANGGQA